jgi:hypothetical protein
MCVRDFSGILRQKKELTRAAIKPAESCDSDKHTSLKITRDANPGLWLFWAPEIRLHARA